MSRPLESADLLARLLQAAAHFPLEQHEIDDLAARGTGPLLSRLSQLARDSKNTAFVWLLMVVVTTQFPAADEFRRTHRQLRAARPGLEHRAFLEAAVRNPGGLLMGPVEMTIVTDAVIADVDFCARHTHNTGIQRVVRQTMARWTRDHEVIPVAWTSRNESMRRLEPVELARVVQYGIPFDGAVVAPRLSLVVPFNCTVLVLEVPSYGLCDPLESVAEYSGNKVGLLGYDAIPVVSADTVPDPETDRFVKYLSVVKHSHRVAGISAAATGEFAGFVSAIAAQGLTGPETISIPLPVDIPDHKITPPAGSGGKPLVLVVGSQEPRKNHRAILHAATVLWREGIDFRLRFIGGGSAWFTRQFDKEIAQLSKAGHSVEVLRGISDSTLLDSYQRASFTVFPSLHEGYGLPVAESLALGVPVITSNYGSTAEIAADGGCLVIDPRSDEQLTDAMRRLLTEPELGVSLRKEISERPTRTWDNYADELWAGLVVPLEASRG
ncbi:MAG: glycosyltransferase [Rhodoglobus sp.]